ncbi:MAG: lipocalin family protein, partial [Chloroflexota bacterium]
YAARNTCTIALCGIKFFFQHTLGREWKFFEFVRPPKEKKLPVVLGRDWMSIQLDSGDDLMVFVFHEGGGQLVTLFRADGTVTTILDFTLTATGQWSSPSTGAIYPSGWRLVIPEIQADLIVTPVLVDQEVINADYPEGTYWEGSSVVTGTFAGRPASGAAYVELSGYVHP